MKYRQENIDIGDILAPEISYNNKKYYPIVYVYEKVLLRSKRNISELKKKGYDDIVKFTIDYDNIGSGGIQNTNCISSECLINLLNNSYVGGLNEEQRKGMNSLLRHFNQNLVSEEPRFLDTYDFEKSNEYNEFEKDCIREIINLEPDIKWQRCKECNRYFPLINNFFTFNNKGVIQTACRACRKSSSSMFIHPDNYLNNICNNFGIEVFISYKNHDTIEIYKHYIENEIKTFPEILNNKEDYLVLIKYLYDNKYIGKENLTISYLRNNLKLHRISNYFDRKDIHILLFGNHPNEFPWHYPHYNLVKVSMESAKIIFNNFIKEHNLIIDDIYDFDYSFVLRKSKLRQFDNDILNFIMKYYDNKYPAYKFNAAAVNYWKSKENRDEAFKYLIEEDMKLEIEKIPLYLTITSIKSMSNTMHNVLKNYYSGIYEWVNEIYPDVFDPKDFDINYMRNEFDSQDEQTIDDILRENFKNVLYNPRNTTYTIKLKGKTPDWFIFTDDGCIIVEYFGLWDGDRGMYNSRTRHYIERSKDKLEKYKELKGYKFLYLYPEDLRNNFEGLNYKIKEYIDKVA